MIRKNSLKLEDNIEHTFAHPDALQPGIEGRNPSSTSVNLKAVSNMKTNLTSMINRVDLLTDTKIGEVKKILKNILDNLGKLNKRVERQEREAVKSDYEKLPVDILALTKDELTLRTDLAKMIYQCQEVREQLDKEMKRLRREHYGNLKDIEQIHVSFEQMSGKVNNVQDRQGLNDKAMASIFKIMKLSSALDMQDELDRDKLYLMGMTNTNTDVNERLSMLQTDTFKEKKTTAEI